MPVELSSSPDPPPKRSLAKRRRMNVVLSDSGEDSDNETHPSSRRTTSAQLASSIRTTSARVASSIRTTSARVASSISTTSARVASSIRTTSAQITSSPSRVPAKRRRLNVIYSDPSDDSDNETSPSSNRTTSGQATRSGSIRIDNRPLIPAPSVSTSAARDFAQKAPLPSGLPSETMRPLLNLSKHGNRRNLEAEIEAELGDEETREKFLESFNGVHLKSLAPGTLKQIDKVQNMWIMYFKVMWNSKEKALASLERDAMPPEIGHVKSFIYYVSTRGKSGLGRDIKGWSSHSARTFIHRIFALRKYYLCAEMSIQYRRELFAYVDHLQAQGILTSAKHEKKIVTSDDLADISAAIIQRTVNFSSRFMAMQMLWFMLTLYELGVRPGTIIPSAHYEKSGHHAKWEDLTIIITGFKPGAGLNVDKFWKFRWAKGMHNDDSSSINTTQRNAPAERAYLDSGLVLEAIADYLDIYTEKFADLRHRDPATFTFPHKMVLKSGKGDLPILRNPKGTGPMLYGTLQNFCTRLAEALGWDRLTPRDFRYNWATMMINLIPKADFRYLLGHCPKSIQGQSTYQGTHLVDPVANMHGGEADIEVSKMFASVGYTGKPVDEGPAIDRQTLENDPRLKNLLEAYREKELVVLSKFECVSHEVTEESLDNALVAEARQAWIDVLHGYFELVESGARPMQRAKLQPTFQRASVNNRTEDDDNTTFDQAVTARERPQVLTEREIQVKMILDKQGEKIDELIESDKNHPLLAFCKNEKDNVRSVILDKYVAMIAEDAKPTGSCPYCSKVDRNNHGRHVLGCRKHYFADTFICPCCQTLLPKTDPEGDPIEIKESESEINDHMHQCLEQLVFGKFRHARPLADDEPDEDSSKGKVTARTLKKQKHEAEKEDYGFSQLSAQIRVETSRTALRIFFCPVCIFDESPGHNTAQKNWEERMKNFPDLAQLLRHVGSHFNSSVKGAGIDHHKTFVCGFPDCAGNESMRTCKYINHLLTNHGIKLLECPIDHCDDSCQSKCAVDHHVDCGPLELHGRLVYTKDARAEHEYLKWPFPQATLVDRRLTTTIKTARANIKKLGKGNRRPAPPKGIPPSPPPPKKPFSNVARDHRRRAARDQTISNLTRRTCIRKLKTDESASSSDLKLKAHDFSLPPTGRLYTMPSITASNSVTTSMSVSTSSASTSSGTSLSVSTASTSTSSATSFSVSNSASSSATSASSANTVLDPEERLTMCIEEFLLAEGLQAYGDLALTLADQEIDCNMIADMSWADIRAVCPSMKLGHFKKMQIFVSQWTA
ncbi:hypothetical protein F5880DRAFT_1610995 [Lentinula raphanica]|nr:hypothetical protein F5880DRAFT_1610995 [Lentinula raphanica]